MCILIYWWFSCAWEILDAEKKLKIWLTDSHQLFPLASITLLSYCVPMVIWCIENHQPLGVCVCVCVCSCLHIHHQARASVSCFRHTLLLSAAAEIKALTSKVTVTVVGATIPYVPPVPDACQGQGLKCPLAANVPATFTTGLTLPKIPIHEVSVLGSVHCEYMCVCVMGEVVRSDVRGDVVRSERWCGEEWEVKGGVMWWEWRVRFWVMDVCCSMTLDHEVGN